MNKTTPERYTLQEESRGGQPYKGERLREPSPLDVIREKAGAGDTLATLLYAHILENINDILDNPSMQPHIHEAARMLKTELEEILQEEIVVYEEIQQISAELRRRTEKSYQDEVERMEVERQETERRELQHKEVQIYRDRARAMVREELQHRDVITDQLRSRIERSLDMMLAQLDLAEDDVVTFVGYGATKDVFCVARAETQSREAIALVHAEQGTTIDDIVREVKVSQRIDIPGIIRYEDIVLLDSKGAVTTDDGTAKRALLRSEYVEGADMSRAAQHMNSEILAEHIQEIVQKKILESYRKSIESAYIDVTKKLDSQYAVYTDEFTLDVLLEQYAATFESILQRPIEEIKERLKIHIQKTIVKQRELYQSEQSEIDIGKEILIRAIAARKLDDEVRKRSDVYRKAALVQLTEQLGISADAIDALHRTGYVHQDIKPDNIIGCASHLSNESLQSPMLIDLGSVANVGAEGQVMKGTRRYMQPEEFGRYAGAVDAVGAEPRKDVRAFAISLFDTLSAGLDIPQLTVFPPKKDEAGTFVSGNTIIEGQGFIIPYYDEDITDKYTFLQSYLYNELQMPYALLAIFDRHEAVDNGVPWEHTCKDMQQAFLSWIQNRTAEDMDRIRLVFSELADPKMFMQKYSEHNNQSL